MGATYLDEGNQRSHAIMGCYGLGINRILAGAGESGNDANGIWWPLPLAPYQVVIVPLQVQNSTVMDQALGLEKSLTESGVEVLTDDRDQRPGVKFKDADLIQNPAAIVVGRAGLEGRHDRAQMANRSGRPANSGGWGGRLDPRRDRRRKRAARLLLPGTHHGPRRCEGFMKVRSTRSLYWPYALLGAMTLVTFGGPFLVLVVVREVDCKPQLAP